MAMDLAKIGLRHLPLKTLQQIAGYLADSHRPSLYAFSLISKTCYHAATVFIFRQVHLTIRNHEELERDVDTLINALSRANSARHVCSLTLRGFLDIKKPMNEKGIIGIIDHLASWKSTLVDEPLINDILPNKEPIPPELPYAVYDESVIERSCVEDTAWAPVNGLVKALPSLAKLRYNCPNQFPPTLLDILHAHHPQCKLYHLTFRLRTLLWDTPYPYEMALATSPCLYSVKILCSARDSDGDDDFNAEAARELAGLAPNLKEVSVVEFRPALWKRSHRRRGRWKGLPCFIPGTTIGSLTSLSLLGLTELSSPGLIQTWAKFTDFACLRHLALGGEGDVWNLLGVNGEVMEWVAQNCSFSQLKSLDLVMRRDDIDIQRLNYTSQAVRFFTALIPLDELSVTGPIEPEIMDAILYRHGWMLKSLNLHPVEERHLLHRTRRELPMIFTKEHVQKIQAQCPKLERLAIPVKRMRSNAAEVEMYKSVAKMKYLQSLFLILDCSDWRPFRDSTYVALSDPVFDEEDCKPWGSSGLRMGHLRVALMNCAVDETLARSIWQTVCQNKVGKQLESLKLWTTGVGVFGNSQDYLPTFEANMSRSWLIERRCNDNEDAVDIKELGRLARMTRDQHEQEQERERKRPVESYNYWRTVTQEQWQADMAHGQIPEPKIPESDKEEMRVFYRIWARKENSKDWREDWSSIPLQI